MINQNKRIGGFKAQNNGKIFENIFERACASVGIPCTRIPDGCRQIGAKRLLRVKTPFDYIVTYKGRAALLDTKTVEGKSFGYSCIEKHQVMEIGRHEKHGNVGGYIIWLREISQVIFVPAGVLIPLIGIKGSIKPGDPGVVPIGEITEFPLSGNISLAGIFRRHTDNTLTRGNENEA